MWIDNLKLVDRSKVVLYVSLFMYASLFLLTAGLAITSLQACAHGELSSSTSLEDMRKECQSNSGIFHLTYSDYLHGWRADSAECWYEVSIVDIERFKTLSAQE